MAILLKITKTFGEGEELWHEARAPGQMRVTFRAPTRAPLKIGDVIEFDPVLADQDAFLPVYESRSSTQIRVRKCDIVDMRSMSVKRDLRHEGMKVLLFATGEIEVHGPGPLQMVGFDDLAGLEFYLDSRKSDFPRSISDWLSKDVLAALKEAD